MFTHELLGDASGCSSSTLVIKGFFGRIFSIISTICNPSGKFGRLAKGWGNFSEGVVFYSPYLVMSIGFRRTCSLGGGGGGGGAATTKGICG